MCKDNNHPTKDCTTCIKIKGKKARSQLRLENFQKQVHEQGMVFEQKAQKKREEGAEKFLNGFYTTTAPPLAVENQKPLPNFNTAVLPSVTTLTRTASPARALSAASQAFPSAFSNRPKNSNVTYAQGWKGRRLRVKNGELGPLQTLELQAIQQAKKEVDKESQRAKAEQDRMAR